MASQPAMAVDPPDVEVPSVFDIELPSAVPNVRLHTADGEDRTVGFSTLYELCVLYETEFKGKKPWEEFSVIAAGTLGLKSLDSSQWNVLTARVVHLMDTDLKKNYELLKEADSLLEKSLVTSSDSPKSSLGV